MQRAYTAIRNAYGFHTTDEAPSNASLRVELLAQVRSNGRILDSIRHVLGGSIMLEEHVTLSRVYTVTRRSEDGRPVPATSPSAWACCLWPMGPHGRDGLCSERGHHEWQWCCGLCCLLPEENLGRWELAWAGSCSVGSFRDQKDGRSSIPHNTSWGGGGGGSWEGG
jgi:hypothetical protein